MTKTEPLDFEIPEILETDQFRLRMLGEDDVEKDYDAVMTSIDHLHKSNPFGSNRKWPPIDLTLEENLIGLRSYQREFEEKSAFAFSVVTLDEAKCLGCVYIYPSGNPDYDALALMWVRQSEFQNGLDEILLATVKEWLKEEWPFEKVAYPGRDISWEDFKKA